MGGDGGTRLLLPPSPRTHALSWAAHNSVAAGFLSLPPLLGPQRLSNLIFPAGEAALGASVAVPPPRPAGAAAGRCQVPKRTGKNRRKGNNNRKAEKKKERKKRQKSAGTPTRQKREEKNPTTLKVLSAACLSAVRLVLPWAQSEGARGGPGGEVAPLLGCALPAPGERAGSAGLPAARTGRPGPRCECPPRTGDESLQRRSDSNSIFLPLSFSSSLRGRRRVLAASRRCQHRLRSPAPPTPPPHVRDGSPDHFRTDPRFQREREEERRWLKGRGERKVRPRRL